MLRFFYILLIVLFVFWIIRIAFPFIFRLLLWLLNRKIIKENNRNNNYNDQTIDYKIKEDKNNKADNEFIEYEELK
ncbi:MAG TPA: hypothetical protein EYP69_03970 [Bacteroidales bacterium]|nr:hypothetical protein [Bacteroidales bacterium]